MSGGSGPYTRWPTPWKFPPSAGRVPTPTPEVVAARPLLAALHTALGGQPAPCASHPEVWTSSDSDDVAVAREGCAACPAQAACLAYGRAVEATCGTWGGTDLTRRDGRRRPTTDLEESA